MRVQGTTLTVHRSLLLLLQTHHSNDLLYTYRVLFKFAVDSMIHVADTVTMPCLTLISIQGWAWFCGSTVMQVMLQRSTADGKQGCICLPRTQS